MISRREPLLWLQLMALAVIPLELELMRLMLAGPAFGPAPALERLLIWGLAVVAPGVLLWRRSADWASLLLVRIAPAKRSLDQRRISAIQQPLGLKAALIIGIGLLLPLFWWVDQSALLVLNFSPTQNSSRLTALLLAGPLLTLILWQWQQLFQAILLLTRSDQSFAELTPIIPADLQTTHLSLGLGLLQPPLLEWDATGESGQPSKTSPTVESDAELKPSAPDPDPDPQPDPAETDADEVIVEDLPEANNEDQEVISADDQDADDAVASADVAAIDAEQDLLKEPYDDNDQIRMARALQTGLSPATVLTLISNQLSYRLSIQNRAPSQSQQRRRLIQSYLKRARRRPKPALQRTTMKQLQPSPRSRSNQSNPPKRTTAPT